MELAGPLGTLLGSAQWKRASSRGEAGTLGFLSFSNSDHTPAQGITALLSATGRTGSGPPPRTPLAWETGGPGSERGWSPVGRWAATLAHLRQSFAPFHRLSHHGKGFWPAAGTVDRSAGEGCGLAAWVGEAAAPDLILGEMEGSSWVWPLPRDDKT